MVLRKTGVACVLAILVAFVAHGAIFGSEHAAGGIHAGALDATLLAAVSALIAATFLRAAIFPKEACRDALDGYSLSLALGPGGFAAYALMELSEGHSPLAAGGEVFFGCALGAALVGFAARFVGGLAREAGIALLPHARYARRDAVRACARRRFEKLAFTSIAAPGRKLGRAPPLTR